MDANAPDGSVRDRQLDGCGDLRMLPRSEAPHLPAPAARDSQPRHVQTDLRMDESTVG